MNKAIYPGLILAASLLPLSGCKPDVREEIIVVNDIPPESSTPEVTHIVRRGTQIIWESKSVFSLTFANNSHPCKGLQPDAYGYYTATERNPSRGDYKYRIDCKLDWDDSSVPDLSYMLYKVPPKEVHKTVTHCEGCVEGTDPNAGQ